MNPAHDTTSWQRSSSNRPAADGDTPPADRARRGLGRVLDLSPGAARCRWSLAAAAIAATALATSAPAAESVERNRVVSEQAFRQIAEVLRHPRCLNCHTVTEFPRQGDTRHRHQQMVMRGADGRGAPNMRCSNCHQEHNSPDGRIPGAHNWHLAPLSMGWEHLRTDGALCRAFVDKTKNGGRDVEALATHMTTDPLVQWAWTPGARPPPPIAQDDFHAVVRRWAATGGACPRD